MRPPAEAEISAPEFPSGLDWLGVPFLRMDRLIGQHAVLVEFWDFARVHSLRTLPYLRAWHERYAEAGLQVIGVHSPGYSFGRDPEIVERAVERLELPYPVVLDPDLEVWRLLREPRLARPLPLRPHAACCASSTTARASTPRPSWPSRSACARWTPTLELPEPLEPLRPEDAPGVLMEPQTADIALPADRERLELGARLEGRRGLDRGRRRGRGGELHVQRGWAPSRCCRGASVEPGLYETDGTVTAEAPGLRLHGVQFTPCAASAFLISRGSMKRTSSWTTSNSETSLVPRSRKKSTRR